MAIIMKTMLRHIPFYLAFLLLLLSCGRGRVFEEHRKLPGYEWKRFENIVFEAGITDTGPSYDIYIAIRHITQYPFSNLQLTSIIRTPSGEERLLEHDLKLRDKDGKPLGDGMGDLWDINIPLRKGLRLSEPGTLIVELENRMPRPVTPGIMEIGLIIQKSTSH